jgi:hypothetical protein
MSQRESKNAAGWRISGDDRRAAGWAGDGRRGTRDDEDGGGEDTSSCLRNPSRTIRCMKESTRDQVVSLDLWSSTLDHVRKILNE